MPTWMAIALGGGTGAVLRWLVSVRLNSTFPFGTWAVNVLGSFLIGLLFVLLASRGSDDALKAGLIIGLLGGFTTFSAFSLETFQLLERGEWKTALLYVASSLIICVLAAFAGMTLARSL